MNTTGENRTTITDNQRREAVRKALGQEPIEGFTIEVDMDGSWMWSRGRTFFYATPWWSGGETIEVCIYDEDGTIIGHDAGPLPRHDSAENQARDYRRQLAAWIRNTLPAVRS